MKVELDPIKIEHYYMVDGERRALRHWHIGDGVKVYVDVNRNKRCDCGVLVYFSLDEDNKKIEVHRTINGFVRHSVMCLK